MFDDLETKVVLKQTVLNGSNQSEALQRVATAYIDGKEYRIYAPAEATGNALDWYPHFCVRQSDGANSEIAVESAYSILALKHVKEELQNIREDIRAKGMHPDGKHCAAQICLNGHVLHCDGEPCDGKAHCTKCGAASIDECPYCQEPIRGVEEFRTADSFSLPYYCHRCGKAYPWMEAQLNTARELLRYDEKLTAEDRTALFDLLQLVMSDPRHPLTPAKKKLVEIKLGNASAWVREAILDLVAKTTAEMFKG